MATHKERYDVPLKVDSSYENSLANSIEGVHSQWFRENVETLRDSCSPREALILGLEIAAWAKFTSSRQRSLAPGDRPSMSSSREFLRQMTAALRKEQASLLDESADSFELIPQCENIPLKILLHVLESSKRAVASGWLDSWIPPVDLYQIDKSVNQGLAPDEVVSLMMSILTAEIEQVYCLGDELARFSIGAALSGKQAYLEEYLSDAEIPVLNKILTGLDFKILSRGNPLSKSSSKPENIRQYESTVRLVLMGKTSRLVKIHPDWLENCSVKTSSQAVLDILEILAKTQNIAVIAGPNNLLFGQGAERALREQLVKTRTVAGVISMPPALLPYTTIPFSILVLTPKGQSTSVRFVKGDSEAFFTKDGRNRATLNGWKALSEIYRKDSNSPLVKDVQIQEIVESNYTLEVSRYVLSPELQQTYAYLHDPNSNHRVKTLADCTEIIRPSIRLYKQGDTEAFEVVASDFPQFGYLSVPPKEVLFREKVVDEKKEDLFLRPHDIIISVKGVTGAVAIAPPHTPPAGKNGWLVNQSCLILRTEKGVDPVYLFVYLASDMGQALLAQISIDAATPLIQLQSLKQIPVPLPSQAEMGEIAAVFEQQVVLQQQIETIQREQQQLNKLHWHLSPQVK